MKRVIMIVLDSVGAGALPDADKYGDVGANTLGHIWEQAHPDLPYMEKMGLGRIEGLGYPVPEEMAGAFGRAIEVSAGKDTTTGHWEMMGLKLDKAFPTYPNGFPKDVMDEFERRIGRKTLGNYPASGTAILDELGEEHMRTGYPIVYTSGDSVFQIACHEDVIPVEELYRICRIARDRQGPLHSHAPPPGFLAGTHRGNTAGRIESSRCIHHGRGQDRGYFLSPGSGRERPCRRQSRLCGRDPQGHG